MTVLGCWTFVFSSRTKSIGFLSVRPTGDRGLVCFALSLSSYSGDGLNPVLSVPLLSSPKSSDPFLLPLLSNEVSVLENAELYGSCWLNTSLVKLFWAGWILIYSKRLELCLGLIVRPRPPPNFSPDGDLGGVSPFYVGEFGAFCIFVMNNGDGGAIRAWPDLPDSSSVISLEMRVSVVLRLIHFWNSWSIWPFASSYLTLCE